MTSKHIDNDVSSEGLEKLPENFAFVMNVKQFSSDIPHTLSTGHIFRRATTNEINMIDRAVRELSASPHNVTMQRIWKRHLPWPGQPDELLPAEEWRYFVIAFNGPEDHLIDFFQASSDISPKEIEIGFTISYEITNGLIGHSTRFTQSRFFHVLRSGDWNPEFFIDIEPSDLDNISSIYTKPMTYDPQSYPPAFDIKNVALNRLSELKSVHHGSQFRYLGYFGILESLLTHTPKVTDPYDSITRQLKKKISLLDNRWTPKLDYTPFGETSAEKVWGKMYALRSRLAHGDHVTFTDDLACLVDYENAFMFLKQAVKATLRYALTEPRLLIDLREC